MYKSKLLCALATICTVSAAVPCYPTTCGTCVGSQSLADSISKECVDNEWVKGSPSGPW